MKKQFTFDLQRFADLDSLTKDGDTYKIGSVDDLQILAAYVNGGNDTTGLTFKQTADIIFDEAAEGESNFTAIGSNSNRFNGTFNGDGYTISDLTINSSSNYQGLFGYVGSSGTILNVNLVDANVSGMRYVGALVGDNYGTIVNCTATGGTITGTSDYVGGLVGRNYSNGTIVNCTATGGTITGTSDYVGGLVGENYNGTVENCTTTDVTVSGDEYIGGLVGYNKYGTVENSLVDGGSVTGSFDVGGIVGYNDGNVTDCSLDGVSVEGIDKNGYQCVGGIAGYNYGTIENCLVNGGTVSGTGDDVGGLVGSNDGGTVENCTTSSTVDGKCNVGGLVGENYYGTVENSLVDGGSVSGEDGVGGLVGYNKYGTVENSLVDGGSVSGDEYIGGLVGYNEYGTIESCLLDGGSVSGDYDVGSFVGNNIGTLQNFYFHNFTAEITGVGSDTAEEVFRIKLPENVMAQGDGVVSLVGRYYTPKDTEITLAGKSIQSNAIYVVVDDDEKTYTITKDETIDVDVYISVNGGTYSNTTENISVIGGDGDEVLINTAADVTLDGGAGNDSLVGSDNEEVFVYSGGSDTINSFTANDDTIRLADGFKVSGNLQVDGDNLEINFADGGKLIIEGAASLNSIKLYNEDGSNYQTILVEKIELNNDNESSAKSATVTGAYADFSKQNPNRTEVYTKLTNITATQDNSQIIGNSNNNLIVVSGGSDNILTGGLGKDTYSFTEGGGIITDFGIGATKSGDGTALATSPKKAEYDPTDPTTYAPGIDALKLKGTVNGIYFDSGDETANDSTFDAVISYNDGDDDQIIVLNNIIKKPTKTGATPIYQTNDVAAETLKIWDTSGNRQAVLSATKLKKLFHDDDDLSDTQQEHVDHLRELVEPTTDITATSGSMLRGNAFTPQLTFSGNTSKN